MSTKVKLEERLRKRPPPTDFSWDELVTVMSANDFTVTCGGGSHHRFQHKDGMTVIVSKTHPSGLMKQYQIKQVIDALNRVQGERP